MQPSCRLLTCPVLYQIFDQYHCDFWRALTISKLRQIDEMNCCFNKSCQTDPAEYASFSELLMFTPLLKSFTVSVQRVVRWTFQRYILELALSKQFVSDPWLIIAHGCQPECVEIRMIWQSNYQLVERRILKASLHRVSFVTLLSFQAIASGWYWHWGFKGCFPEILFPDTNLESKLFVCASYSPYWRRKTLSRIFSGLRANYWKWLPVVFAIFWVWTARHCATVCHRVPDIYKRANILRALWTCLSHSPWLLFTFSGCFNLALYFQISARQLIRIFDE